MSASETQVSGEHNGVEYRRQFEVQRVSEASVVATGPGTGQEWRERFPRKRSRHQPLDSHSSRRLGELASSVESPNRREHFGIEMRWHRERPASER